MRASRAPPARTRAQVAGSYAALAALLRAAGRGAEALAVARLAAAAQEGAAGVASPAAAAALLAVAEILADLGRCGPRGLSRVLPLRAREAAAR